MASETTTGFTGNAYLDGILWGNGGGSSQTHASKWSSNNLTYSYSGSWNTWERAAVENAIDLIESVSGLTITFSSGSTDLRFNKYHANDGYLGFAYPPDPAYGTGNTGNLYYNSYYSSYWSENSLETGGAGFVTVIHELGHALGLGHPHDNSFVLPGVTSPYDPGTDGLNTNLYTVMSYIDIGQTLGDGTRISGSSYTSGLQTLGAFDIAALQHLYGVNATHYAGDNFYELPDQNVTGTEYHTIWDTGGTDTIRYAGSRDVEIDLRAATLQQGDGALTGGAVSSANQIYGGYTIANGVVVENAVAGSGNDTLTGNAADNTFTGGLGNDTIHGGEGSDTAVYGDASSAVEVDLANGYASGGGGLDALTSIENVVGSDYDDILRGTDAANRMSGGTGSDVLIGAGGNDVLYGDIGSDILNGGDGDDLLRGSAGNDTLIGGAGIDTADFSDASAGIVASLAGGWAVGPELPQTVAFEAHAPDADNQFDPRITELSGGRFVVVWESVPSGGGATSIAARVLDSNGYPVGDVFQIGGAGVDARQPDVVALDNGNFAVFWASQEGSPGVAQVHGQIFDATGEATGPGVRLNTDTGHNHSGPDASLSGGGQLLLTWGAYGQDGDRGGVFGQVLDQTLGPAGTEFQINQTSAGDQLRSEVTALSNGNHVVIWSDFDGFNSGVFARVIGADGTPVSDDFRVNLTTYLPQGGGSIAALQDGKFMAFWTSRHTGDFDVYGRLFNADGSAASGEFRINSTTESNQQNIEAIGLADGSVLVTWENDGALLGRHYAADGGALSAEFAVTDKLHQDSGRLHDVLQTSTGDLLFAWQHYDVNVAPALDHDIRLRFSDVESLKSGTSQEQYSSGSDSLREIENLIGTDFDDALTGDDADNVLDGGAGNDVLDGRGGVDTVSYASVGSAVTIDLVNGVTSGGGGSDTIVNIERFEGSGFDDLFLSGPGADLLDGGAGEDTISYAGAGSAVQVNLATGSATGGGGADTLVIFENVIGSAFADTIIGDGVDNTLDGLAGDDLLDGGAGTDTASYATASAGVAVDLSAGTATGGAGTDSLVSIENIIGSAHDDAFVGNASANRLDGGAGTDMVSYAGSATGLTVNMQTGIAGNDTLVSIEHVVGSDFADTFRGANDAATFDGRAGDDIFVSGAGDEVIIGGGGTDWVAYSQATSAVIVNLLTGLVSGGGGTDTLSGIESVGGSGFDDTLTGDAGTNALNGGDGDDVLLGGGGDDVLDGGEGNDTASYAGLASAVVVDLIAGSASGGGGNDTLIDIENVTGTDHDDVFVSNGGQNTFRGGAGSDTVSFHAASGPVGINLNYAGHTGDGADFLYEIENIIGSAHDDGLIGDAADNRLYGGAGEDTLMGGSGSDLLDGGTGNDALTGGTGDDIYVVDSLTDLVIEAADGGFDIVRTGLAEFTLPDNVEQIELLEGTEAINLMGNASNNRVVGGSGSDRFDGGAGDDVLEGGEGYDWILAGEGNDVVRGGNHVDNIWGQDGDDDLYGDDGDDGLSGGAGRDRMWGGEGSDLMFGQEGDDFMDGGAGTDHIHGWTGNDTLLGGDGLDILHGDQNNDHLEGGAGMDFLYGGTEHDNLYGQEGDDYLDGGTGDDNLYGWTGSDTLIGGDGDDVLHGDQNNDGLLGGQGNDRLYGGSEDDQLFGQEGNDVLDGGTGNDQLYGWTGHDVLDGGEGDDTLYGDQNNDTLTGGAGNDLLYGGSEDDLFIFADGHGADRIGDFTAGAGTPDRLDLQGITAVSNLTELLGVATQDGADTVLDFGNGDTITLIGVDRSALHSDDFLF